MADERSAPDSRERWRRAAPALLFVAALGWIYRDVLLGRAAIVFRDMGGVHWPVRRHFAARLLRGELPEWYPFDGLGSSYAGNGVNGLFHPSVLLHLALPDALALSLGVVLARAFAAAGTYRLLRHWKCGAPAALVGAVGFALSGYLMSMDGNLPYLLAGAALPWAVLGLESGSVALCAASMALVALSGERAHTLFFGAALLLLLALTHERRRRALAHLAASGAVALLASAAQLLPALDALNRGSRDDDPLAVARLWAFNPLRFLELLAPGFLRLPTGQVPKLVYGQERFSSFWADSVYLGAAVAALAVVGLGLAPGRRLRAVLGGFGAFCLLAAVGSGTDAPLFEALQHVVPGFTMLRYPEKNLVLVVFAVACLAGMGAEAVLAGASPPKARSWLLGALGALFATVGLLRLCVGSLEGALLWLSGAQAPGAAAELAALMPSLQSNLSSGVLLAGLSGGLALALLSKEARLHAPALVLSALVPALVAAAPFAAYRSDRSVVERRPEAMEQMEEALGGPAYGRARVFASYDTAANRCLAAGGCRNGVTREILAVQGLESCPGFLPQATKGRRARALDELPAPVFFLGFNVRYSLPADGWGADRANGFGLLEGPPAGDRIRLVQAVPASSLDEALAIASQEGFDPVAAVPVEGSASAFPASAPVRGSLRVERYSPERIEVTASSETDCALFVADAFAPGWTATVDGAPAEIVPGLVLGRAIAFPKGSHRVELAYRTPGLRAGLALSALGWALVGGFALAGRRRRSPAGG